MRLVPLAFVLLAAAGCAAGQQQAVDLPPPCAPDVATRILADRSAIITPPTASTLSIPPERPGGGPASTYRLTLTVAVDGQVVPGSVRVAGPDHPAYTPRLVRWAEGIRFRPATAEGCAIQEDTELVLQT
jgi:hypothetical protein